MITGRQHTEVKPQAAGLIGRSSYLPPLHYVFKISPAEDSVMDLFYSPDCVCVYVCALAPPHTLALGRELGEGTGQFHMLWCFLGKAVLALSSSTP